MLMKHQPKWIELSMKMRDKTVSVVIPKVKPAQLKVYSTPTEIRKIKMP